MAKEEKYLKLVGKRKIKTYCHTVPTGRKHYFKLPKISKLHLNGAEKFFCSTITKKGG